MLLKPLMPLRYSSVFSSLCVGSALLLAGCATSLTPAPVTDRSPSSSRSSSSGPVALPPIGTAPTGVATLPAGGTPAPYAGPNADKAGQPGYYVVKPGDTVMRVALETGQYWRDVVRWNTMENPNVLEVGQVLRVAPPQGEPLAKPVLPPTRIDGKPLGTASAPVAGVTTVPVPAPPVATAPSPVATAPTPAPASPPSAASSNSDTADEDIAWSWPAAGSVIAPFDETRNRGIDISGKAGDPVFAAAEGRVIYADSGLRGYGNLVILRHNNTFLTAYAHNSKLLVKEGDAVKRNQRIAEMGNSASDRVKLHFEIRRLGKAVDPSKLLPSK
jgi:lipoprotein NlpD